MSHVGVRLASSGHEVYFTHATLWGAALIAEAAGHDVRMAWDAQGVRRSPVLTGLSADELAAAVQDRARRAVASDHWMQAGLPHESMRALFSPRVKGFAPEALPAWEHARAGFLDRMRAGAELDLALIAALGEPSSWHRAKNGDARPDHAASRLEMQPRNQGSEFVGTRLRALAEAVAGREPDRVAMGLAGDIRTDEAGKGSPDSRSAANLMPPTVTDNVVAWMAMWGLAATEVVHRVHRPSMTATHLPWPGRREDAGAVTAGHLVAPLWQGRWTAARLRAVLRSRQLHEVAVRLPPAGQSGRRSPADVQWLRERGVQGLVLCPVHTFGSVSSPERRAMPGVTFRLGDL